MTQKEIIADISDGIKSWDKDIIEDVPIFYLYYYYPKVESVNQYNEWVRKLIWDFKKGINKSQCATMVTKVLQRFFLKETLASMTFVCIPASTKKTNETRYRDFSKRISENCNMQNGYNHIKLKYDREAKHLSGEKDFNNLEFERKWFKGKKVVIFDDIVTSGSSISNLKNELTKMGATIIGVITLGRTVHEEKDKSPYHTMDKTAKPEPPISEKETQSIDKESNTKEKKNGVILDYNKYKELVTKNGGTPLEFDQFKNWVKEKYNIEIPSPPVFIQNYGEYLETYTEQQGSVYTYNEYLKKLQSIKANHPNLQIHLSATNEKEDSNVKVWTWLDFEDIPY